MTQAHIAPHVQALLRARVHSVESLEVLLLIQRDRTREWEVAELAAHLDLRTDMVERVLQRLGRHGVIDVREGRARWHDGDAALDEAASDLARAYEDHAHEVLRTMNVQAIERAREWAVRRLELGKKGE